MLLEITTTETSHLLAQYAEDFTGKPGMQEFWQLNDVQHLLLTQQAVGCVIIESKVDKVRRPETSFKHFWKSMQRLAVALHPHDKGCHDKGMLYTTDS